MFARHKWTLAILALASAATGPAALAADVDYARDVRPILKAKCFACHGALKQEGGLRLDAGELIRKGGDGGAAIVPGDPDHSPLVARISSGDEAERMPAEGKPLTAEQIAVVREWIRSGAKSPANEEAPEDPRQHWAFQPIRAPAGTIDGFVRERLHAAGLEPAPEADRVTLARRLYLDMHGLPPNHEEIAAFAGDQRPDAWSRLVDQVLASPRYGERWAQHWLDVVRYADTHGYEVNTPRDNAWPYRDYVIRAFNEDKPYDRFVFEQLAGDTVGEDAATGFLVAAAVLLPGQIGADEESKRLARQDALDDVIVGTGATFLGLTVGCARCHDHKFDPLTQQDYYALQAFFAGVEYGDREMNDPARRQRLDRAEKLAPQIAALEARLKQFEPLARTGRTLVIDDEDDGRVTIVKAGREHESNPDGNGRGSRDDAGSAERMANLSRGRHSVWKPAANENVFSWNPQLPGRFRLWLSWGARGDDARAHDPRYLLDADGDLQTTGDQREIARIDQRTFAHEAAPVAADQSPWSGLYDAGTHDWTETTRLVLRSGEASSTVTADVIVLQEAGEASETTERRLPRLRGPASPRQNVERFAPAVAKFVRFTSLATIDDNLHEPCIDELEVYAADGAARNLALAELGTKATSSGNISETGIHQLRHVNDGQYGNGHSWISNEKGAGWVQLELAAPQSIDRIVWGRDREGHYEDRLAVRYRIDVSLDGAAWTTVAASDDRAPRGTPHDEVAALARSRPAGAGDDLAALIRDLKRLTGEQAELKKPTLVYGGNFRRPDATHVLHRGDPEQPGERIGPRVPQVLGKLSLALDAPEPERRVALARWMIARDNPLPARVLANRVWQFHFGRGLVDTPSDFGLEGDRPSHPELLDWLATQLVESGWSIKHLHRLILNSATYRQSSRIDPAAAKLDADCRLLWRYPSRRLEAEAIRDSMLAASGQLNLAMGGPGFAFFKTRGGLTGFPPIETFGPNELRRMIYSHKIRMEPVPVFGAFDCPDAGQAMPKRSQSTTALQALNLFNSPFVAEQAAALAGRVEREAGQSTADRVRRAWLVAVGRVPEGAEAAACQRVVEEHGLVTLCRVILNSNEFLFIP
jgi:mono/diheme cytochrome c family protein